MAGNTRVSSVDNLINDIRELYSKSKSSLDISCDMVDEKLSKRANATQRQLARNVAKASKQFEEMVKKRSFAEKMIERSKTVHASPCSTMSGRHGDHVCSCEKLKNESSLLPKKIKSTEMCCYGRIPQVFIIEHNCISNE